MLRRLDRRYLAGAATVFAAAFFMRVFTLWQDGALHYQGYGDEGVYYLATIALGPHTGWLLINSEDARSSKVWQRQVQDQLEMADAVIMGPFEYWYLDETNRDYIRANFHHDVHIDPGGVDVRERYGVTRTSDD